MEVSPEMQKVVDIVDQDERWQLAFSATSQGKTYVEYVYFMDDKWKDVEKVSLNTYHLITCMYKAAL